jgi:hephaestin
VSRELLLFFTVFDETASLLGTGAGSGSQQSAHARAAPELLDALADPDAPGHEAALQGHQLHSINGFVHCNMPELRFSQGEAVRFHVIALGTEVSGGATSALPA